MNICVIGLGLIGGSMAKDLRSQLNVTVVGVDHNESHCKEALELGLVDRIDSLPSGVAIADIIILSIPVKGIVRLLPDVLDLINDSAVVIDVGSTKEDICISVHGHPKRTRFVAAHPLAGTEFSGPRAAIKNLFPGKKNIICEKGRTDSDALETAVKLFASLGMESYFLNPSEHDRHLAYVSHLSHISSFTLSLTVQDIEKDEEQIFNLASTGFESTVRLAKSSPSTWAPIFSQNSVHLSKALDQYIEYLTQFKKAIENQNNELSFSMITEANKIKKLLNNKV